MIRVFLGYDHREIVAYHVACHSIQIRSSKPVEIAPVMLSQLEGTFTRERNNLQSNDFSFSRFLVPHLCGYEGGSYFEDYKNCGYADTWQREYQGMLTPPLPK